MKQTRALISGEQHPISGSATWAATTQTRATCGGSGAEGDMDSLPQLGAGRLSLRGGGVKRRHS
jgi:hypothetical protein